MGTPRRHLMLLAAAAASLILAGCGTGGAGSDGSSPQTTPASTPYIPASGTDATGILFPVYTNKSAGYSFIYPGGWRIAEKPPAGVRISRFGNAITAVVTARSSVPFYKGYQKTLESKLKDPKNDEKQLSAIDIPASQVKIGKQKAVRVVIEQVRPTGTTTPDETVVVVRYLFWKSGKLLTLSMSSVKGINNTAAYDLIASKFHW
jgi:hypothetical protein